MACFFNIYILLCFLCCPAAFSAPLFFLLDQTADKEELFHGEHYKGFFFLGQSAAEVAVDTIEDGASCFPYYYLSSASLEW